MSAAPALPAFNPTTLSPRAAAYFQSTFQPRYQQLTAQIALTPFTVVLWGPGPGSLALYNKRVQIRDELRLREQAAFLAEELPQMDNLAVLPRLQQLVTAASADLAVVMVATLTDLASANDFSADAVVHSKLIIFSPDVAQASAYHAALAELAAHYDNVKSFVYPDDIASCHLRALVLDKLSEMQIAKWRAIQPAPAAATTGRTA